jgi:hypothetical protein
VPPQFEIVRTLLRAIEELAAAASQMADEQEGEFSIDAPAPARPERAQARPRDIGGTSRDNGQAHKKVPDDFREAIIKALGDDVLSGKELAGKLDRAYGGRFRDCLAALRADGTLIHTVEGYEIGAIDP